MFRRRIAALRGQAPLRAFVLLFLTGAAVAVPAAALVYAHVERQALDQLEAEGLALYRGLAAAATPSAANDFESAAARAMAGTRVVGLGVYHAGLAPLARAGQVPATLPPADAAEASQRPIRRHANETLTVIRSEAQQGEIPWLLVLRMDTRPMAAAMAGQARLIFGGALLFAVLGAAAGCAALWRRYVEPAETLTRLVTGSAGSSATPDALARPDALGDVARALDGARHARRAIEIEQVETEERIEAKLRQRARELFEAKNRAEAASRAKSAFLANMSHELRTPLNAIIGFSGIMSQQMLGPLGEPKYLEYAGDINRSAVHLLGIVNDVLDTSKIESHALELREETFDVMPLIMECTAMLRDRIQGKGIALGVKPAPVVPAFRGDRRRLKQIFINLLSNAEKFTENGGSIDVHAARSPDGGLVFAIADTGIGMSEAEIETALTLFGQVDSRLARAYEGSGLGLPLTKALVELHQGRMAIESRPGRGTTVTVSMPAHRSVEAREPAPV